MANIGVSGRIINDDNPPIGISGLKVTAYDVDWKSSDVELGSAITSSLGNFTISYSKWAYGLERKPDIKICVFDYVNRLVYESPEYPDISNKIFDIGNIRIPKTDLHGWLVTLRTGSALRLSQGNSVSIIIDNMVLWEKLTQSIKDAKQYIFSAQLYLDVGNLFTVFNPSMPQPGRVTTGERLEEVLLEANRNRGVDVRLLINDFSYLPYPSDTADKIEDYFNKALPNSAQIKRFHVPYNRTMHAKFTLIDNLIAIINASPLMQEYYGDSRHSIDDPRRGKMEYPKNAIKVPIHDVNICLEGPVIKDLHETFTLLWRGAGGTIPEPMGSPRIQNENIPIQIVRTLPGNCFVNPPYSLPNGELGILEAYQRAISNAADIIYIENQYLTEESITNSLLLKLKWNKKVQVILLINNKLDIPFYQGIQTRLINKFRKQAYEDGLLDRIGIFTLWTHETIPKHRMIRNYVHSKVAIVDDKWATIGSANLDGVSLVLSQHVIPPITKQDMLEERAVEVNAIIYNGVDGLPSNSVPDELRRNLWAEHLGFSSPNVTQLTIRPNGGWLKLWKDLAALNLAGLKATPPSGHRARILEWTSEEDPIEYLKALGLSQDKIDNLGVIKEIGSYDFNKGKWC